MQFIGKIRTANTWRLALSYLGIIMIMSLSFSAVFYHTSIHELASQIPSSEQSAQWFTDKDGDHDYHDFIQGRTQEGREHLMANLAMVNFAALLLGGVFSFALARITLQPIEAALEAQGRFASDASHELRTPLAAIRAENEVALRSKHLTLDRARALLQSNLEEVARLRDLSEGLLRLARQDSPSQMFSDVVLADVTTEAINHVIKLAQAKHIVVHDVVPRATVKGDALALQQVLAILLDNAIKYSPEHTVVRVEAHTQHANQVILTVSDGGPGIGEADLGHIFERFYRGDVSRSSKGYGLGLSIAQKIVQQHKGTLEVQSKLGAGTTFTIALPLGSVEQPPSKLKNLTTPLVSSPSSTHSARSLPSRYRASQVTSSHSLPGSATWFEYVGFQTGGLTDHGRTGS